MLGKKLSVACSLIRSNARSIDPPGHPFLELAGIDPKAFLTSGHAASAVCSALVEMSHGGRLREPGQYSPPCSCPGISDGIGQSGKICGEKFELCSRLLLMRMATFKSNLTA